MFWKKQMNKHESAETSSRFIPGIEMGQILIGNSSDRHYDDTYSVELSALVVEKTFVCTSVLILGIVSKRVTCAWLHQESKPQRCLHHVLTSYQRLFFFAYIYIFFFFGGEM